MIKYITLFILLIAAVMSTLLAWQLGFFARKTSPLSHIDIEIHHLTYQRYNQTGQLIVTLKAPLMKHHRQHHQLIIQSPHIILKTAQHTVWQTWSTRAVTDEHYETVQLIGHVKMKQTKPHTAAVVIRTDHLTLIPKRNATTDAPISVTQGHSKLTAVGAKINFKNNEITLSHHIRAHYQPDQEQK